MRRGVRLKPLQLQILAAKARGETDEEAAWNIFKSKTRTPVTDRLLTIYKKLDVDNIVDALRAVIDDIETPKETLHGITDDQMKVAGFISKARSVEQIALRMFCSPSNVRRNIREIYRKTGCRTFAQIAVVYLKHHSR